jgi:hypothetical protein
MDVGLNDSSEIPMPRVIYEKNSSGMKLNLLVDIQD